MKIVKTYCDVCGCEITEDVCAVDLCPRPTPECEEMIRDPPFGRDTVDGVWEIEVCATCFRRAVELMKGMKGNRSDKE